MRFILLNLHMKKLRFSKHFASKKLDEIFPEKLRKISSDDQPFITHKLVNLQNSNGKLFAQFLDRMPQLTLINSLPLCEGLITRMRKTTLGTEMSILYVFVTCNKILPYVTKMKIDEKRVNHLSNLRGLKCSSSKMLSPNYYLKR